MVVQKKIFPHPGTFGSDLTWKKGLADTNTIKDPEMRSSWMIWVGPKSKTGVLIRDRRRPCEDRTGRDRATS